VDPALGAPHPGQHRRHTHYDDDKLREVCIKDQRFLVTFEQGAYPHSDAGVEVRRILHLLAIAR
jgi:hypothetical protein